MELSILNSFLIATSITFIVVLITVVLMVYFVVRKIGENTNNILKMLEKQCDCEHKKE